MSVKVFNWLENLGLGQYAAAFEENDIGWDLLGDIDQETLKDIGVISAGHRLQILKAAKSLRSEITTPTLTTTVDITEAPPSEPTTTITAKSEAERRQLTVMFCDLVGST